ncbi:MAG: GTPase domain-containing protein, partial [Pirellulales bacterium]|nr:GTPase domain-containing protein [Pirellulales bacterium]
MARPELVHLELLAQIDALTDAVQRWGQGAPDWQPGRTCQAMVRRLGERTRTLRIRLEAPLVVATLGGTGVGKSALVNALVGADVVETGRSRPTTRRPRLICRPDITPQLIGIPPEAVELVQRDLPALSDLVVIDCPDPDTTEEADAADTNLTRLRQILPHCDVLLVATTQQKYRSARVSDELNLAATGAQLVFVQTHADTDEDIRDDWRRVLEEHYATGHIFLVDSIAALADAQQGLQPRGEFAGLVDLLTRRLVGAAATRIRRANFLDLVSETLEACDGRIQEGLPAVRQLESSISQQRGVLASQMAAQMRSELLASRRQWEARLTGQIISRW